MRRGGEVWDLRGEWVVDEIGGGKGREGKERGEVA